MAGKVYYKKLIRDKIPEKIEAAGSSLETRVLEAEEFETELRKKIQEESRGVLAATTREELIRELADVQDVIDELKRVHAITEEEMSRAQHTAYEKKGGFTKRLFLEWSSDDGYSSNEHTTTP